MSAITVPSADAATPLERALAAVRELREKVVSLERARHEPIAVVGIGCRLPSGVGSPGQFWRLLVDGVDAVTEIPDSRWDRDAFYDPDMHTPGRMAARHGAFLTGVDEFDPYFFGISPREASRMDPQQRLFLEVAWEALEDAGQTLDGLRGSATGVFVGANASDYLQLQMADPFTVDTYTSSGGANSVIPNRLSYLLDLRGPSITVDTACSSSLVAVHLAAQSLRGGECDAAVVGGMNVILSPMPMLGFSKLGALSPGGRCKTFDARADGYVRGEGVTAVVLRRLSDAVADGDRVWAVVRGSAVNQDGLTNGLTAPNGSSQREVIERALRGARLDPSQVTLLEAHGTGTALGDPIEVEALDEAYGGRGAPVALGSVKTNIGHLEAGAGLAGLVKAALSIHHRTIAPNVHFASLNPHIALDESRLFVPTTAAAWDVPADERHAAVSAFGAGGTNAHVILGPAPAGSGESAAVRPTLGEAEGPAPQLILPISARGADALEPMVAAYRDHLRSPETRSTPWRATVAAATVRRTQHEYRCAVVAESPAQAAGRLEDWLAGKEPAGVAAGRATSPTERGLVFICPGQGTQRPGMARELMRECRVFRDAVTECDEAMREWLGRSAMEEIQRTDVALATDRLEVVQAALFAVTVGLAARWRSFGVEPDVLVGHSMGEVAAAHIAGALSLRDATRLMHLRSTLLRRLDGSGTLLVIGLPMDQARELITDLGEQVSVAVNNSPTSTVLSGDSELLAGLAETLRARKVFCREVVASVAGHGPQVDRLREDLLAGLGELTPRRAAVPILSTVTGELSDGTDLGPEYWFANLRRPVLFWDAVQSLAARGNGIFIELSPHPMLLSAVEQSFELSRREFLVLPSMRRDEPETLASLEGAAALHAHGYPVRLPEQPDGPVPAVALPRYAWRHERFWFREPAAVTAPAGPADRSDSAPARPSPTATPESATSAELADRIASAPGTARYGLVAEHVTEVVADVLGMDAARIDPAGGFFQMGMDSLMATRVRARLERTLALSLATPVLFEHPTVEALSAYLVGLFAPAGAADSGGATPEPRESGIDDLGEDELLAVLEAELQSLDGSAGGNR